MDTFDTELVRLYPNVFAFGLSLTKNQNITEDLVQETMRKALEARERFIEGMDMAVWLFTILRNTYFTSLQRDKTRRKYAAEAHNATSQVTLPNQEDYLLLKEIVEKLETLLPIHRSAVISMGLRGFTREEAAEEAGCGVNTVKSHLARARKRLRQGLEEQAT